MKIKDFLKPDKKKLIVLIAISVLSISYVFLALDSGYICADCFGSDCSCFNGCGEYIRLFFPLWPISIVTDCNSYSDTPLSDVPLLFIDVFDTPLLTLILMNLPYWYLLSCLIVFGYHKLRKRG